MKIVVLSELQKQYHKDKIQEVADRIGAEVCFVRSEDEIPEDFQAPDVIY